MVVRAVPVTYCKGHTVRGAAAAANIGQLQLSDRPSRIPLVLTPYHPRPLHVTLLYTSSRPPFLDLRLQRFSRYGHILSPTDLGSFLPSQDPAVALHVARLQTLMSQQRRHVAAAPSNDLDEDDVDMTAEGTTVALPPTGLDHGGVGAGISGGHTSERSFPPDGPRARNRRYRRLQQLAAGGVWFSDEAMKEKDPWLWFEYVGRREGEEKPAPKAATEKVGAFRQF